MPQTLYYYNEANDILKNNKNDYYMKCILTKVMKSWNTKIYILSFSWNFKEDNFYHHFYPEIEKNEDLGFDSLNDNTLTLLNLLN